MERRNLGRQKIEMTKMTNESNLQVTFSKRRAGLFKKASEISTLCGVEVALVVFSPGNKAFSFGVPSVDTIIDRYLGRNQPESSITSQIVEAHRESNVHQLNMELTQLMEQLETKKKLGEELHQREKANQRQYWCQKPVEELDLSHLQQLKSAMDGFKRSVQAQKVAILNANPHQSFLGSSSQGPNPIHDFNNMMDGGYFVPHMSVPSGYNLNPPEQFNLNHVQRYSANPLEGFNLNPVQRYNVNPENRYNTNSQEINILGHGFGGYNVNPQGNDVLHPPGFGPQGFGGGFF